MKTKHFTEVPGLILIEDFFSHEQCHLIIEKAISYYEKAEAQTRSNISKKVNIPQPDFVTSGNDSLVTEKLFFSITLNEQDEKNLHCEFFPNYGEEGHALLYFRGNNNIPDFIQQNFLNQIQQELQTTGLIESGKKLLWKLTTNFYKANSGKVAGFPFHVDIPANGIVTMILNIQRKVQFQIAKGDIIKDFNVPIGSLLILSKESRYDWKHRVLPMKSDVMEERPHAIERISLVLGFHYN